MNYYISKHKLGRGQTGARAKQLEGVEWHQSLLRRFFLLSLQFARGQNAVKALLLHDPVTWYGINYAATPITHWDYHEKRLFWLHIREHFPSQELNSCRSSVNAILVVRLSH